MKRPAQLSSYLLHAEIWLYRMLSLTHKAYFEEGIFRVYFTLIHLFSGPEKFVMFLRIQK
jgi:hypothetical protein